MEGTSIRLMEELLTCGTNISLWHYDTDGHLLETNAQFLVLDKILGFIGNLDYLLAYAEKHKNPLILGSDMGLMWCAVLERDRQGLQGIYLMGPVYHAEISGSFLEESAARYQVDPAFRRQYVQIMKGIPVVPAMMLQQYGLMLHYCVNGEKLNRSDIYFQPRSKVLTPLSAELEEFPRDWGTPIRQSRPCCARSGRGIFTTGIPFSRPSICSGPWAQEARSPCSAPFSGPRALPHCASGRPFLPVSPWIRPMPWGKGISKVWPRRSPPRS